MESKKESPLSIVNASGFAFQLRIEQEIRSTGLDAHWQIAAREHRWYDVQDEKEAFIDLVLQHGIVRMVLECKRVTDAQWIFLVPEEPPLDTEYARLLWTLRDPADHCLVDWHDFSARPHCLQSAFCAVMGKGEKEPPMLERVSSVLLRSLESLANQELTYKYAGGPSSMEQAVYVPVVVTNATLYSCDFDAAKVDISTGRLPEADFRVLPWVRFRKNLSSTTMSAKPRQELAIANKLNERTVFVVNSGNFHDFMTQWDMSYGHNSPWPWEGIAYIT